MEIEFLRRRDLQALETRIGYQFDDLTNLDAALTHTSFVKGDGNAHEHNERLEFLGDAVLELCVSEYLYRNYPKLNEGVMTRVRAASVCESALHAVAVSLDLGSCLQLSRGEERSGGRKKPSILADAVEAVIGAIYLDGGVEQARTFILRVIEKSVQEAARNVNAKDYKTRLQEYVQKLHKGNVTYVLLEATGPDHQKEFTLQAVVAGEPMGVGRGGSKQEAGQAAARETLYMLGAEKPQDAN